jgi:phage terminase large subunit-like protein
MRVYLVLAFFFAALTPCFAHHTAVVVNKDNSVDNVSSAHLVKIIRGEVKRWPDGTNIVLVLHRESAGEDETLERLNKMSADQWRAFVETEPGAIGMIEVRSLDNSVNLVHVDGKLPMEFGYLPH